MAGHLMMLLLDGSGGVPNSGGSVTGYAVSGSTENTDANGTYCPDGTFNGKTAYSNDNGWHLYFGEDAGEEVSGWVVADAAPTNDSTAGNGWLYIEQGSTSETPDTGTYLGYFASDDVTVAETTCP